VFFPFLKKDIALVLIMQNKYYPIVLVTGTGKEMRFKMVKNPAEYEAFCTRHLKPGMALKEIKTLSALYTEKMDALSSFEKWKSCRS
jgi:hypothetical protein